MYLIHGFRGGDDRKRQLPQFAIGGGSHERWTIRGQHGPELNPRADERLHIHVESSHARHDQPRIGSGQPCIGGRRFIPKCSALSRFRGARCNFHPPEALVME